VLVLMFATAWAGTPAYQACCADSDAGACPVEVQVSGPGTTATAEQGAVRLIGLWRVSCAAGAVFDSNSTNVTAIRPPDGTILTPIGTDAAACFDAACNLPAALCVHHDGDHALVVECATGAAPASTSWNTAPVDDTRAVVIGGRPLTVRDGAAASPPPTRQATVYQAGQPPEILRAQTASTSGSSATRDKTGWDLTVPPAPPQPCKPNAALRDASASQVDAGNDAALGGDYQTAINKYRAAISISQCNAFAWADLGEAFLAIDEAARAKNALGIATSLMPTHYQAWTNLGRAEESLGRPTDAADAYSKALQAHPGYPPADEGLQRVRTR
jgi:hypothetical protein